MKSAFFLASPRVRAHLRRSRLKERLNEWSHRVEDPVDAGYLHLAELLLTGVDRRELPEDEKVDGLIA